MCVVVQVVLLCVSCVICAVVALFCAVLFGVVCVSQKKKRDV